MNRRSWLVNAVVCFVFLPLTSLWLSNPATSVDLPPWHFAWQPFAASLAVALVAASIAVLIGGYFALLFSLTDLPAKTLLATLLHVAFACPPTVWALTQVYAFGLGGTLELWLGDVWRRVLAWNHGSYLSTAVVLGQIHAPIACLLIGRGVERIHFDGWEAAVNYLSRRRLLWWLVLGLRREITSAFLVACCLSLCNFAVPHVMQCRLYSIEIYQRMANYLDPRGAATIAAPLLLFTLLTIALAAYFSSPTRPLAAVASRESLVLPLGRWRWLGGGLALAYLLVCVLLPFGSLVVECKSLPLFWTTVRAAAPELQTTVRSCLVVAGLTLIAALVTSASQAGQKPPRVAAWLSVFSLAIPTLLLGLAYARVFHQPGPWLLRVMADSEWLAAIVLAVRCWPFAHHLLADGRRRIPDDAWHAADLAGVRPLRRWCWLTLPLLSNHLLAGAAIAFALSAGDVEISQLLCAPGHGTLALRLFTFLHFGPAHVTAGLAMLQLLVSCLPLWFVAVIAQRRLFTSADQTIAATPES